MEQRNSRKGGPRRSGPSNSNTNGSNARPSRPTDSKSNFSRKPKSDGDGGGFKKPFKSFGDKPSFQRPNRNSVSGAPFDRKPAGDRSASNPDFRKSDSGEARRPFKSFGGDNPNFQKPDRPFGARPDFKKRPFSNDNRSTSPGEARGGDRPKFGNDRPGGFKKRESFGDGAERKPFSNNRFDKTSKPHDASTKSNFGDNPAYKRRDNEAPTDARGKKRDPNDKLKDIRSNFVSKVKDESGKEIKTPSYDNAFKAKVVKTKRSDEEKKDGIRLNRFIANSGVCSRRDADMLISTGEITVNGVYVTEMGYIVKPTDVIKYSGRTLKREKNVYVLLNKPKDFITTTTDPDDRRTVMDLVAGAAKERLFPVGRLDRNTTGLLLLTNDGDLAETLSHPSNRIKKIYQVTLDKPLDDRDFEKIQAGLQLEDGLAEVDEIAIITNDKINIGVEIHIGRNRIVRRIFESLGYDVVKLDRVLYAELTKRDLPRGNWRYLTEKEVIQLQNMNKKKKKSS